jgi:hypothetical protein
LTFANGQGLGARRIPVGKPPFPASADPKATAALVTDIFGQVRENFGHAGPAYVERLQAALADPQQRAAMLAQHARWTERLRGETDLSARRAPTAAAIALAAVTAHEWGIVPLPEPAVAEWVDLFTGDDSAADEDRAEQALDVLRSHLAGRPDRIFIPRATGVYGPDQQPVGGWMARLLTLDGVRHLALDPAEIRKVLDSAGCDYDASLIAWKESGAILSFEAKDGQQRTVKRWSKRSRLGPGESAPPSRLLVFAPEHLGPDDDGDSGDDDGKRASDDLFR